MGLFRVPSDDIVFIGACGNYSDVYLFNGDVMTMTFQLHHFVEALGKLNDNFFVRVGKSLIVNKNYVCSINIPTQELVLIDNRVGKKYNVRASKEALKELKNMLDNE